MVSLSLYERVYVCLMTEEARGRAPHSVLKHSDVYRSISFPCFTSILPSTQPRSTQHPRARNVGCSLMWVAWVITEYSKQRGEKNEIKKKNGWRQKERLMANELYNLTLIKHVSEMRHSLRKASLPK